MKLSNDNFLTVNSSDTILLEKIKKLYFCSFPENERRPWSSILYMLDLPSPFFTMIAILDDSKQLLGFYTLWHFPDAYYLEHFAIDPLMRGNGIGGEVIRHILSTAGEAPLILEVELPDSDPDAVRRISFYESHGLYAMKDFPYYQPPYSPDLEEVPMMLMTSGHLPDPKAFVIMLHTLVYNQ